MLRHPLDHIATRSVHRAAVLLIAALGTAAAWPAAGQDGTPPPHQTAAEAGARYGQAKSVEQFCPGGRVTALAAALPQSYKGAARTAFDDAATKVIESWSKALGCSEIDPATGRANANCRKIKVLSCRQAWQEIGPQGALSQGLIELSLDGLGGEPNAAAPHGDRVNETNEHQEK